MSQITSQNVRTSHTKHTRNTHIHASSCRLRRVTFVYLNSHWQDSDKENKEHSTTWSNLHADRYVTYIQRHIHDRWHHHVTYCYHTRHHKTLSCKFTWQLMTQTFQEMGIEQLWYEINVQVTILIYNFNRKPDRDCSDPCLKNKTWSIWCTQLKHIRDVIVVCRLYKTLVNELCTLFPGPNNRMLSYDRW